MSDMVPNEIEINTVFSVYLFEFIIFVKLSREEQQWFGGASNVYS